MTDKLFLGNIEGWGDNGRIYLTKHTWDCSWYWGFGYLGNRSCHFHIDSLIKQPEKYSPNWHNVNIHFNSTWLTQDQWWILRDLFIQAYALRKAAETYRSGGHQTDAAKPYRITSGYMVNEINEDLEKLLNNIWDLLTEWQPNRYKH